MDYYSFTDPRRDERLSWPGWLTHSRHLTHKVVTCQPYAGHKSGKVRQSKTDVLTTEPRHQPSGKSRAQKTKLVHTSTTASSSSAKWKLARLDTSYMSCREVTSQVEFGLNLLQTNTEAQTVLLHQRANTAAVLARQSRHTDNETFEHRTTVFFERGVCRMLKSVHNNNNNNNIIVIIQNL